MLQRIRAVRRAVALVVCIALTAGCASAADSEGADLADAYILVLEWVLAEPQFAQDVATGDLPLVFVESFGSRAIDFEVQVDIIMHFEERVEVRFIDIRSEALEDLEGEPVRDGGILIGLGDLSVAAPHEIRGEVYRTEEQVDGYRFRVELGEATGFLLKPPEPIEPEVLVAEP